MAEDQVHVLTLKKAEIQQHLDVQHFKVSDGELGLLMEEQRLTMQ